eukprot:5347064-Amphidinium_carterae.1
MVPRFPPCPLRGLDRKDSTANFQELSFAHWGALSLFTEGCHVVPCLRIKFLERMCLRFLVTFSAQGLEKWCLLSLCKEEETDRPSKRRPKRTQTNQRGLPQNQRRRGLPQT